MKDWHVSVYPIIYLIDHRGIIRYRNVRSEELDVAIDSLIIEAESSESTENKITQFK